MKKAILFLILMYSTAGMASVFQTAIQPYQPVYFVAGDKEDQVKFQVSAKYSLIFPSTIGLYAAYTQKAWWKLYDESSPFYEFNHEPELFWIFESKKNFMNLDTGYLDYFQVAPIYHKSNGRDGEGSRSINCYYARAQFSVGEVYNFGIVAKIFGYYSKAIENKDIEKYQGYVEGEAFFQLKSRAVEYFDKEKIYIKGGGSISDRKGWIEGGIRVRIVTTVFQPFFFVQAYHGYAEKLIDYNKKDTAIRAGITFE